MTLSAAIGPHLPFLRRYARALTGTQSRGDTYVTACLEAILASPEHIAQELPPRVALYRAFHLIWSSVNPKPDGMDSIDATKKRQFAECLHALSPLRRQALLLTTMESFSTADAAEILGYPAEDVERMVKDAMRDMLSQRPTTVLIIEDEPVISLDLRNIVEDMGHTVTCIAATRNEAVAAALKSPPGLVLADIQLADDSSGIDAVNDILRSMSAPVIFITAYPERLLSGTRPEPTFLVTKPFMPQTVTAAVGQALFLAAEDEETQKMSA